MSHHINDKGEFQSDKYPDLPPDKIILSFRDPEARKALDFYASLCRDVDEELSKDIHTRLDSLRRES